MSVRMKITHGKTGSRRAHHRASVTTVVKTATGVRRKHFVDPITGMYRGKQIIASTQKPTVAPKAAKKTAPKAAKASTVVAKKSAKKSASTAEKKS